MNLKKFDAESLVDKFNDKSQKSKNIDLVKKQLNSDLNKIYCKKSVLGFDIYRYSQFNRLEQTLIPYLFNKLYTQTINSCLSSEPFFFQHTNEDDFRNHFIDTGDGGFQIFETPLHAVIFAIYFQGNIKRYNSGHIATIKIKNIIGEISLRYSLTFDEIFKGENNFYGPAIINNARIMSKDKLNRFLVDSHAVKWFNNEFNGIDTIQLINVRDDYQKIPAFSKYKSSFVKKNKKLSGWSLLMDSKQSKIISSDILHIGEIKSKLDTLDVYSVHIQARLYTAGAEKLSKLAKIVVSLGNLNSSGINEDK